MGPLSAECPKILLEVGGLTLLERHARLLAWAGVTRLHVVTGHLREVVASRMEPISRRTGLEIVEVFNEDFTEGSVISMAASIPVLRSAKAPVLVMDGDVLYDHRLLAKLLDSRHGSALLVDRIYSTADDDPVLVPMRNGRPFEFRKKWAGSADWVGESIGFFRLDRAGLDALILETEARGVGERRKESYDEVLRALVVAGRFGYEDVTGCPWTEVDFPEDLVYAREAILPRLEEPNGSRRG